MQPNIKYAGNEPHMPEEPIWTNLAKTLDEFGWTANKVNQSGDTVILRIVEDVQSWMRDDDGPCPLGYTCWFYRVLDPKHQEYCETDVMGEETSHEAMMVARQFLRPQQIEIVSWRDQADTVGHKYLEAKGLENSI